MMLSFLRMNSKKGNQPLSSKPRAINPLKKMYVRIWIFLQKIYMTLKKNLTLKAILQ